MKAFAVGLVLVVALAAGGVLLAAGGGPGARGGGTDDAAASQPTPFELDSGTAPSALAVDLDSRGAVRAPIAAKDLPASGLLFDVDSGEVLWQRNPEVKRPIASLTKMMTALVVADELAPGTRARISRFDAQAPGSAVGALPVGRRIGTETLLYGLMLASGNDAARALAARAGGSQAGFIRKMNDLSALLGMRCSHFNTPNGYRNADNYSCAADLAAQARAILRDPRLARIVGARSANLPWPVKRGKRKRLELYNHNPLLLQGYRGVTGVKTGYTDAAGSCFVVTARRGDIHLGLVLLDSPDIDGQARALLGAGFRARRVA